MSCFRHPLGTLLSWLVLLVSQSLNEDAHHMNNKTTDVTTNNGTAHAKCMQLGDTLSVRRSRQGLRELRIAYKGVLLLETSRLPLRHLRHDGLQHGQQHALSFLQVSDGRRLVQSVKEGEAMKDCRVSSDSGDVMDFLDQYLRGVPRRAQVGDVLAAYYSVTDTDWTTATLISSSRKSTRQHTNAGVNITKGLSMPLNVTKGLSMPLNITKGLSMPLLTPQSLGPFVGYLHVHQQAGECHRFLSLARHRIQVSESTGSTSDTLTGGQDSTAARRQKRDLLSGWFIFPGTKWCGDGDIAENGKDLGYDEALDMCCRDHDRCPHVIPRLSWGYALFNYRLHTLSHCRCDRRFRRCLKKSTSPTAHLVGKIYFNVIGPQCFKFARSKTCKIRNWWGRCKKYGLTKVAVPQKQKSL